MGSFWSNLLTCPDPDAGRTITTGPNLDQTYEKRYSMIRETDAYSVVSKKLQDKGRRPNPAVVLFLADEYSMAKLLISQIPFYQGESTSCIVKFGLSLIDSDTDEHAAISFLDRHFSMFGTCVHPVIYVGPFLFEWNASQLTLIQARKMSHGIAAIDIGEVTSVCQICDLARVCVHYNTRSHYRSICNSQYFARDAMHALGLKMPSSPALDQFLNHVSHNNIQMEYGDEIFTSHAQLDDYYYDNMDEIPECDYLLLKAFDRAFQLQGLTECEQSHRRLLDIAKRFCPSERGCPFGSIYEEDTSSFRPLPLKPFKTGMMAHSFMPIIVDENMTAEE